MSLKLGTKVNAALLIAAIVLCGAGFADSHFAFSALGPPFLDISGFEKNCRVELFRTDLNPKQYPFPFRGKTHKLSLNSEEGILQITTADDHRVLKIDFLEIYKKLSPRNARFKIPQTEMIFDEKGESLMGRLVLYNLSGKYAENHVEIFHVKADLLLK